MTGYVKRGNNVNNKEGTLNIILTGEHAMSVGTSSGEVLKQS